MTPVEAVVLALVQAVTEFLPISSSGHLILIPRLLGWSDQGIEFDIATNSGTLLAVMAFFRTDVRRLVAAAWAGVTRRAPAAAGDLRLVWALLAGTIPAALAGLLLKGFVAGAARNVTLIAANAIGYGLLLGLADWRGAKRRDEAEIGPREALLIGCAQALALVPGTSRSGVTMTAALLLGFRRPAAARFAFLLSIPIGLLVGGKQLFDLARGEPLGVPLQALAIGVAVSAVAGYAVVAWLLAWIRRHPLTIFAVYRVLLGLVLLLLAGR